MVDEDRMFLWCLRSWVEPQEGVPRVTGVLMERRGQAAGLRAARDLAAFIATLRETAAAPLTLMPACAIPLSDDERWLTDLLHGRVMADRRVAAAARPVAEAFLGA